MPVAQMVFGQMTWNHCSGTSPQATKMKILSLPNYLDENVQGFLSLSLPHSLSLSSLSLHFEALSLKATYETILRESFLSVKVTSFFVKLQNWESDEKNIKKIHFWYLRHIPTNERERRKKDILEKRRQTDKVTWRKEKKHRDGEKGDDKKRNAETQRKRGKEKAIRTQRIRN